MAPSESLISELNLRTVLIISNKIQNIRESHLRRRWRSLFSVSWTVSLFEAMLPFARLRRGFVVMFYNAMISVDMKPLAPSEFFHRVGNCPLPPPGPHATASKTYLFAKHHPKLTTSYMKRFHLFRPSREKFRCRAADHVSRLARRVIYISLKKGRYLISFSFI